MQTSVFMSSCVNQQHTQAILSLMVQHYCNLIHESWLLNVHRPRSSRHHVEQACQGKDHQEAPSEGHLQRLRHVRPVSDPGVQRGVQHDRPEQGRFHRQGGSARHARLSGYTGLFSLHCLYGRKCPELDTAFKGTLHLFCIWSLVKFSCHEEHYSTCEQLYNVFCSSSKSSLKSEKNWDNSVWGQKL